MIIEYHRPTSISEALSLLARKQPLSYPLGGGTVLNRCMDEQLAIVDLQSLGLGTLSVSGNLLMIGATVTLQELSEFSGLPADIIKAIQHEATYNLRQMATVAGKLVSADGRSPFATALFALDASLEVLEFDKNPIQMRLGDWFQLREHIRRGKLISMISVPLNVSFAYEYIARTPADLPIVCVASAQWDSGRTRLVLGGYGKFPILALDGPNAYGFKIAARNAFSDAEDEWASSEYRQEMAGVLAGRCLHRMNAE